MWGRPPLFWRSPKTRCGRACPLVVGRLLLVLGGLLLYAFQARSMAALQPWHLDAPASEFRAVDEPDFDFDDYLELEGRVFTELASFQVTPDAARSPYIRYCVDGPNRPDSFEREWNRSWELVPDNPRGAVLLIHGLTDSPYSLRSEAEFFHGLGFYVLCMRLPGHGTVPAGLLQVAWKDWEAAVRIAARHVHARRGDGPFYINGYSCGGALAVSYAAQAVLDPELPRADRLFLFSPAIGITEFARTSNWHKLYSWIPYFRKSKWLSIEPEYDPFKYNSFAKNAGAQMWELARVCRARVRRLHDSGQAGELPPILAFQSVVDATITASEVVEGLFELLEPGPSELVVFDVNRVAALDGMYSQDPERGQLVLRDGREHPYRFTVLTNAQGGSSAVAAHSKAAGSLGVTVTPLGLSWPLLAYSLSHVAIPFATDDPLYGVHARGSTPQHLLIGDLALRGEKHVLTLSPAELLRIRCNPFHAYMLERMRATLAAELGASQVSPGPESRTR